MQAKLWSEQEIATLREVFPRAPWPEIMAALPSRTRDAIRQAASVYGARRVVNRRQPWTEPENATLRRLYPTAEPEELLAALPGRAWTAISKQGGMLNIRRQMPGSRHNKRPVHPVFRQLRERRVARKMSRVDVSRLAGYHVNQLLCWELGKAKPAFACVCDWADALGMEIVVRPKAEQLLRENVVKWPDKKRLMAGR